MNLRDLQYLVALSEHRHFGQAADACFVSQPTLSTQIRKLEQELGVTLIERTPRQALLTEVGREIVKRAREVLNEVDEIKAIARRTLDPESGSLRLGIFPTLGPYLLPHVVPEIHRRFPRLELLLFEEKTERVLDMLQEGALDAAVLALPILDDSLYSEFLFEEPFLLAVPESHPLATRASLRIADLANQNLLLLEEGHCLRAQALDVCHMSGASERAGFRATSLETLRQMVAADVGATLLPSLAVHPPVARAENVHLIPFRSHAPSRRIAMLWRKSSSKTDFLRRFAEIFKNLPPALLDPNNAASAPATAAAQRRKRA